MWMEVLVGDCRTRLRELADESVHCAVTSPPYYGLRDYGAAGQVGRERTPDAYVAELVSVFREVRRVLRADGTLWLNLGDSYASGGRATYRSGASDNKGQLIQNDLRRPKDAAGTKPKDLLGIPWRVAFALQADGWYLRQDIIWHKPNVMPESVRDRCTKAHEYVFLLSKSERYYFDHEAIKEPSITRLRDREVGNGESAVFRKTRGHGNNMGNTGARNKRSVWSVNTLPYKGAHFATFPPALIEPCVLAGCPEGGTVLDPFLGAGTTGLVCARLNRNCIGVELNPDYARMAENRLWNDGSFD